MPDLQHVICLLGAESTGKTALTLSLAQALRDCGLDCAVVPETLRQWCDEQGRTPRPDEQADIAHTQAQRIAEAAQRHPLVLADTSALMTAVYSDFLFADRSLYAHAAQAQARYGLSLLTGLDLPWVADGLQRDGPQVREPVDALLRQALQAQRLPYKVVYGQGAERDHNALSALVGLPWLQALPQAEALGERLRQQRDEARLNKPWQCEHCSDGGCEHKLFTGLLAARSAP
ncbi:ATP-binding protein [Curvibacter sp. RS43]|uniref:ATP-binding protein n=1 Tax=Curvibacter microcysteis TaxID=3026419 RepID=UPI00235FDB07|nr:ATP-binding protein [Curvibacter sp. RS43]MDD0812779.1 ATP-binding protein [Curvibacter sp. RS43]